MGCDTTTWWGTDTTGLPLGFANLALTAHDLALVLSLLVNRGRTFGSRQLLEPSWVTMALNSATPALASMGLLTFLSTDPDGGSQAHHDGDAGQWYVLQPARRRVVTRLVRWDKPEAALPETCWPQFPEAIPAVL